MAKSFSGAPAIAIVAALALAVELDHKKDGKFFESLCVFPMYSWHLGATDKDEIVKYIDKRLDYLMGSRPTAVDLSNAIKLLKTISKLAAHDSPSVDQHLACADVREAYIKAAEKILEDDLTTNLAIGRYGAEYLRVLQKPHMTPIDGSEELRYFTTSPPNTQGQPDQAYRKLSVLTHCNTG